jgi:hypothetical protein
MEYESRSSLRMGTQSLSEDYLKYNKKYGIKYIEKLSFPEGFRLQTNRSWHKLFRSVKVLYKITSANSKDHDVEFSLPHAIECLKEKRSLHSFPIKIEFSENNLKTVKKSTWKLFRCLRSLTELDLVLSTENPDNLLPIIKHTRTSACLRSYKIKLNLVDQGLVEIPHVIKGLYKKLNKFAHLSEFCFNLKGVQLSDRSLQQLFSFNQLRKPVKSLKLLTDRLENIEDEFDDFGDPVPDVSPNLEQTWQTFSHIELFAPSLTELHIQPLFRNASDHKYIQHIFTPLSKLTNLQTLVLELPHLELTECDVMSLGNALSQLKNLKKLLMLTHFGMVSQKTINNFYMSMQGLNLYEGGINMNFLTKADHSYFFKAMAESTEIRIMHFRMSYMADFSFDESLCEFLSTSCSNLKQLDLSSTHLMKGLKPTRKEWNARIQGLLRTLQDCKELESLNVHVSKMSGINENMEGIIELIPNLPNLQDLIFDLDAKDHEVDYELGKMFWNTVFQNNRFRKLIMMFRFRNAEKLMAIMIPSIALMEDLECFYTQFSSDKIDPLQIIRLIKQLIKCKFIEAIRINFKLKAFLENEMILKIQQALNKSRFLKHGLIEIQCGNQKQKIFPDGVLYSTISPSMEDLT